MQIRKERKDSIEHRRIILQKAQLLFTEYGVDSVTMHQIAKSAGIGQGTFIGVMPIRVRSVRI